MKNVENSVARIAFTRFGKEIKKHQQTGRYSLQGSFDSLILTNAPVCFVFIVYWAGYRNESFVQSFALMDEADNVLDEMPSMEFVLDHKQENVGAAFFYVRFPNTGHYHIKIYQNGVLMETVPLSIEDPEPTDGSHLPTAIPSSNAMQK